MNKINYQILGTEKRKCSIEDCEWEDRGNRYGVYLPDGKYYCSKHANLLTYKKNGNKIEP